MTAPKQRRRELLLLLVGLGSVAAASAGYLWLTAGEIQENRYDSYSEARRAIDRGWLPAILPRSAVQIHERHDLDTSERVGSFRFASHDRAAFESALQPGLELPMRIDRDPSFAGALPANPLEAELREFGFIFYAAHGFGFAINWSTGVAYFW